MRIYLVAIGQRLDNWVIQGYQEYARRLPPECQLHLIEVPPNKRSRHPDIKRIVKEEGERLLAAVPGNARRVALDAGGQQWTTRQLADHIAQWMTEGRDVSLLVGGPDGLSEQCKSQAETTVALSRLTFPHPLVRIIVAEQVYRAVSILKGHPYHR
ncbi:MAG: 23S rRNA (pseudouridine(1915)-N(3))-methyltransferase RlmH [Gammaproteobacteria bacterium]|jgi:23S rRNA (pseudouridine1915-N3)-methyltransferase